MTASPLDRPRGRGDGGFGRAGKEPVAPRRRDRPRPAAVRKPRVACHRGRFGRGAGLALLVAATAVGCTRPSPPNIILITLDTTRADALGIYGRSPSPSPNLDRFAESAVVYDRAYAPSSWTLPSHASLFTGLLPHQHGAGSPNPRKDTPWDARPLGERYTTLAELLRDGGYRTCGVVGGPAMAPELGMAQGFDEYDGDFSKLRDRWYGKRAAYVVHKAIEYLGEDDTRPYFLFVNLFDPHRPYKPPLPYDAGLPASPTEGLDKLLFSRLGTPVVSTKRLPPELRDRIDRARSSYEAEIRYMDGELGRLLKTADGGPRESWPLVVITADHGESFGEHYYTSHGLHLYDDNVRVPLVIRDPRRRRRAGRFSGPVAIRRLFTVLLDQAGITPPAGTDRAGLEDSSSPIITEVWHTKMSISLLGPRGERDLRAIYEVPFKLIVSSTGATELYDLDDDPGELHDLAAAQPDRVKAMRHRLAAIVGDGRPLHGAPVELKLDEGTKSALKALGYTDD